MYIYHKDIVFPKKYKKHKHQHQHKKHKKNTNHYANYVEGNAAKHNLISPKDNL